MAAPLLPLYPVIVFDALGVRIRGEGTVRAKAVYLALGIAPDGTKDVLGLWIEQTKGAKFLAPGGDRAEITTVFPQATVQTCIVHLLRYSLDFVTWQHRKACLSWQPARCAPAGPVHAARNDWSRSCVGQPAGIGVPAFKFQLP